MLLSREEDVDLWEEKRLRHLIRRVRRRLEVHPSQILITLYGNLKHELMEYEYSGASLYYTLEKVHTAVEDLEDLADVAKAISPDMQKEILRIAENLKSWKPQKA